MVTNQAQPTPTTVAAIPEPKGLSGIELHGVQLAPFGLFSAKTLGLVYQANAPLLITLSPEPETGAITVDLTVVAANVSDPSIAEVNARGKSYI
jgi:hypothetical protein